MHPIRKITLESPEYPELLRQIADPPRQLYCRGDLALLNQFCFAVVGTRKLTSYGQEAIRRIVPAAAGHCVIVSGLAIGADAAAHQAALDAGGRAIAVLGGPVSDPSPKTNAALARRILESGGLLVSEYGDGDRVFASNFAVRDRIISGISRGVLVIEAAEGSGSLVTAQSALDQNRDVFAVPGSIFSPLSRGTNWLIRHGAALVSNAEDILKTYDALPLDKPAVSTANPTEQAILGILHTNGPLAADSIIEGSGQEASRVLAALSVMEIKGLVRRADDGTYQSNA
ncbi:MAG TPA: DNA-processing protein DprA [Candidatus Paceibacterota bacterium]|nr:DNA-processing protein DprA [Candidatus Paceibacterota bacterium]